MTLPNHALFQVQIQRSVEIFKPPVEESETDADADPAERDELLDHNTAVEQSDWLWTS